MRLAFVGQKFYGYDNAIAMNCYLGWEDLPLTNLGIGKSHHFVLTLSTDRGNSGLIIQRGGLVHGLIKALGKASQIRRSPISE